jgi:ABC-type antimicrobial peptide transport system permease subunit
LVGPLFGKNAYSTVVLRTADAEAAASVASDLTSTFKKAAVQATPEKEYFARLNSTNQQFLVSILFVAFVVLIGGSLGMMNAMFAAISSRIKDIGVLRIIGFAPWQVLFSFLLEALLLSLIGGVLGCAAGMLADGWSANSIVSGGAGGGKSVVLKMTVDGQLLVFGLLFSLTIGLIGGLVPAFSAMFIKPLDALR